MLNVLIWWLVLQLMGVVALPVTLWLLRFLPDRGYGYARPLGLLFTGYLFWLLVSLKVLPNSTVGIVVALLLVAALSWTIWRRQGPALRAALTERRRIIIATEGIFALALFAFALFRAFSPNIAATEKPMEYAFLNGILRSPSFPPNDPWLSGYAISYYYFGYVIAAMLTHLSGLPGEVTFNLTGATLFALTVGGAFSLVYNMAQAVQSRRPEDQARASGSAMAAGGLAAVLVALMGNLEGIFELIRARGGGSAALWAWLDIKNLGSTSPSRTWYPDDGWWWWRASRVIHDRDALGNSPEVIHEFPFFSFLLGDNHPHVLALPFVLLMLALALNLLFSRRRTDAGADGGGAGLRARLRRHANDLWAGGPGELALWGLVVGSLGFMNTWDYPIYLGILVLVYLVRRQQDRVPGWDWLADGVTLGVVLLGLGIALYFPFYLGFRSQAGGIGWVGDIKTRLHQYLIVQGVFVFMTAGLLVASIVRYVRPERKRRRVPMLAWTVGTVAALIVGICAVQGWWTAALAMGMAGMAGVFWVAGSQIEGPDDVPALDDSTTYALLLAAVGFLLTFGVEFVFLRDTFGTRMNTVFKFYYQAWVLLGIASAYGAFLIGHRLRRTRGAGRIASLVWGVVSAMLVAGGLSYTVAAIPSRAEGFRGRPTLNGTHYVEAVRPHDADAARWLRENAVPGAVMLEAPGGSYSEYNWVSAHTGIPTLLGWAGHELQWRG
ncbi:MAG TPA: hypothetical protein GX702_01235, partial [Chloroflexi bacterium]|nr:hypothetical protein [Chloroflexota bacterium]